MKKTVVGFFIFTLSSLLVADVKYVSTTTTEFEGAVGAMMNLFGAGNAVKTVDYYKDNIKRSDSFDKKDRLESSQLVDLDNELFVSIDHKDKKYTQMTFDEWKEMMQSAMESTSQGSSEETSAETEEETTEVDWDLKVDVNETGETEKVAGKKTDKVIMTLDLDAEVTSTEEGQEPESAKGGLVVTSTHWLYKGEDDAGKEMEEFNSRLVEKLGFMPGSASAKEMMAKVLEQNSQLGDAIETMQEEGKKLQGVSMRVETLYETKVDPETAKKMEEERAKQKEEEKTEIPTSVGGLLGGFGKKLVKKQMDNQDEGVKERNTLMRTSTEVLELDTLALDDSLFEIPSDYKLVERRVEE
jgi:hypothetical protein